MTSPCSMSNPTPSTALISRLSRRTRLFAAAVRPASRTGTLNVLRKSATWTAGAGMGASGKRSLLGDEA